MAAFSYLPGLTADTAGSLYLADEFNHRIRKTDPSGIVSTVVGAGSAGISKGTFDGNHRPVQTARLNRPFDVKTGPGGIYIAGQLNNQVRVVDEAGIIRAAPGSGIAATSRCLSPQRRDQAHKQDAEIPLSGNPSSVGVDSRGNLLFTLPLTNQIKKLSPHGRITNVAGRTGKPCRGDCASFGGDGDPAQKAALDSPSSLTLDPEGNIYILQIGETVESGS